MSKYTEPNWRSIVKGVHAALVDRGDVVVPQLEEPLYDTIVGIGTTEKVTRFEVIDETGRILVLRGVHVELSLQDEGRTLKVFLKKRKP